MNPHLVIGLGEVGSALRKVLGCDGYDSRKDAHPTRPQYDFIHICFPYDLRFAEQVRMYQRMFNPKFTVIHSTVPIGTSKMLKALHSPIRGKHPNLAESIKTFTKYIAGPGSRAAAEELKRFGIRTEPRANSDDTEAGKLLDLMQYGMTILLNKEIYKFCEAHGIDFDLAYRDFNESYNVGYNLLGHKEFTRPILTYQEGKIGGHCVVQMMELLPTESAKKIISKNKEL